MIARHEMPEASRPAAGRHQTEPQQGHYLAGEAALSSPRLDARSLPLVDREEDRPMVSSLLLSEEVRLLTLTGPAGVGKTRLALEVARDVADHFPDGVVFVDLAPVENAGLVFDALAMSLLAEHAPEDGSMLERLEAAMHDRTMLIILDNVEHVLSAAPLLAGLLAATPRVKLLVTSREPLHLRWEQIFHVPPLALPDPDHLPSLQELAQVPSVALFLQRARAINPDFALTEENARAVAELVVHLDGLPLAIELAASRTTLLSPRMIVKRLGQRLSLLRWQAQDVPERHQTLSSAIAWSYGLLSPEEQALFRRLGVFAGSFSLQAAEAIAEPLGLDVIEALASLVDKSLVQVQELGLDNVRYVLLESIRDFARERLTEAGELAEAEQAHARHYLDLAEEADAELRGRNQLTWRRRLEAGHDNFRAVLRRLLDGADYEQALRLAGALGYFWWLRGYASEGSRWLQEALDKAPHADPAIRARALLRAAPLLAAQGDAERAGAVLREALALAQTHADRPAIALALTFLGAGATAAGKVTEGQSTLQEAMSIWEALGDEYHIGYTLAALAGPSFAQGQYQAAAKLHTAALARLNGIGDLTEAVSNSFGLALDLKQAGDQAGAMRLVREALKKSVALQDRWMVSVGAEATLLLIGESPDAERLARLLGAGEALAESTGFKTMFLGTQSELSLAGLRERIERENLQDAYHGGRALGFEAVAALALELLDDSAEMPASEVATTVAPAQTNQLSPRELDVLRLLAEGLSNKEIAKRLIVAESTAKYHVTGVFNKLGVDSRAQAVARAAHHGLI